MFNPGFDRDWSPLDHAMRKAAENVRNEAQARVLGIGPRRLNSSCNEWVRRIEKATELRVKRSPLGFITMEATWLEVNDDEVHQGTCSILKDA